MDYQSLITVAPWTFIAQILNLLLQAYLFKRFLFQPVKKILAKRQQEINGLYTEAEEAKSAAELAKSDYEARLSTAAEAAEAVAQRTIQSAKQRSDAMVRSAQEEASAIKEKASRDIAQEKKKALNEVKDEISGIAMEIASRVVEKEIREQDHQALVEEFIEKIGEKA